MGNQFHSPFLFLRTQISGTAFFIALGIDYGEQRF